MDLQNTKGYQAVLPYLLSEHKTPFDYQLQTWTAIHQHKSGIVNAPTGYGKTYAVFIGALIQFLNTNTKKENKNFGLQLLWITPLRALAKDIARAMQEVIDALALNWQVAIRNGDTTINERQRQRKQLPEVLIITPESLQLVLAQKDYEQLLQTVKIIAVDEWHELIGSKRGVQAELAISRIVGLKKELKSKISIWGISATIENLAEAAQVLLQPINKKPLIVKAKTNKKIDVESIIPDEIEKYPWAGHLGIKLIDKLIPIIDNSTTTLIFINTRGMSEVWYQSLLTAAPHLAGAMALHHGSIEQELRIWVEEALHTVKLKAVVCTASLDLGVDFRPVETVVQVGSPKSIARFLQRAGRSGHQPNATPKIYFLPTHSLELCEAAALKLAITQQIIESKPPMLLCYDVLIQYLTTLAVGKGFEPNKIFDEIKNTFCFSEITLDEYNELLFYLVKGGKALVEYDEYKKIIIDEKGIYKIANRKLAMLHRINIGTIVSEATMKVKLQNGGYIGSIEEYFISRLNPGDVFTFAGRNVALSSVKDMTAYVKLSNTKKAIVPSWMGGRMSLTANLGSLLRHTINTYKTSSEIEMQMLQHLFKLQAQVSSVPDDNELLIEHIETKDGFHLFVYPFEGRLVHEAMAAILAYRISKIIPITFSIAMNDYGFELLSDKPIPVDDSNVYELFSEKNLTQDISSSINGTEMVKRKFRDIAVIGGLIIQSYPGERKQTRHLQSSAGLLYKVFETYDAHNLLLRQAYNEVYSQQMEEYRLRSMLQRIAKSKIVINFPSQLTPFCFPIKVDSLNRNNLTSETLADRVAKMIPELKN